MPAPPTTPGARTPRSEAPGWIPEVEDRTVNIRTLGVEQQETVPVADFIARVKRLIADRSLGLE